MIPAGPSATASTWTGPGSEVNTTSTWPATAAGETAQAAPRSMSGWPAATARSWTTS